MSDLLRDFRFQVENGCGSEKSMPAAENSKELCTPPTVDPGEHGPGGGPIAGVDVGEGVSSLKEDAAPAAVAVNTPTAEGRWFVVPSLMDIIFCFN